MYYYLYEKATGVISSSSNCENSISTNGNNELSIISSETNYEIALHKVRLNDLVIIEDQEIIRTNLEMEARRERGYRLKEEVDPLLTNPLRWAELTDDKQAEWTQYRTDLLNLPEQSGFPNDITWPTKPT